MEKDFINTEHQKTLAIDFDGVVHKYSWGWNDGTIYDVPIDKTKEYLQKFLDDGYKVVIYSTRCFDRTVDGKFQPNQREEMKAWLEKYEIPYTEISKDAKPLAHIIIDDRALRFEGNWLKTYFTTREILGDL